MVSPHAFAADPLRVLRLARLACELGFEVEPETARAARGARAGAGRVAAERVFAELRRIVIADRALAGLELMDSLGATAAVLPELDALRGIEQSRYHHLDVYDHTQAVLAATIELERRPAARGVGDQAPARRAGARRAARQRADARPGAALRGAAARHRQAADPRRHRRGPGHVLRPRRARAPSWRVEILARLRASEQLADHVAALTRNHLRLGFLVHELPLPPRRLPLPARLRAGRGRRHRAQRRRPAGHARAQLRAGGRASPRAGAGDVGGCTGLASATARGRRRAATSSREALGLDARPAARPAARRAEEASFAGEIETREQAIARARELLDGRAAHREALGSRR